MRPLFVRWHLLLAIPLLIGASAKAHDGLHDVEIIAPGSYPVQDSQLPQPLKISPRLAARLQLPGEQRIYPLAALSPSSLAATECPTHVHNFYYSGRADFQCPIISGGRTRVVTVHPATGEPLEFFVMLAAGAPKVEYRKDHFAYVYADHRTVVHFPSFGSTARVTVKQKQGPGLPQRIGQATKTLQDKQAELAQSNTAGSLQTVADAGMKQAAGLGVLVDRGISGTIETTKAITDLLPGSAYLKSLGEQGVQAQRDNQIRQVQREATNEDRWLRWPN